MLLPVLYCHSAVKCLWKNHAKKNTFRDGRLTLVCLKITWSDIPSMIFACFFGLVFCLYAISLYLTRNLQLIAGSYRKPEPCGKRYVYRQVWEILSIHWLSLNKDYKWSAKIFTDCTAIMFQAKTSKKTVKK